MPDLPDPLFLSDTASIAWHEDGDIVSVELWMGEGDCIVLAHDHIGEVATTITDDGDVVCEVVGGQDFIAMAAQLLRLRGYADNAWCSEDGTTEYVRIGPWLLTVADRHESPVHMVFPSDEDAQRNLEAWVRALGGTVAR
jgi:hypothetical protein